MAKHSVTEEDLLAGVGGGFGTITQMGSGRPLRDSPFRDTRTDERPATPAPQRQAKAEEPAPQVQPPPTKPLAVVTVAQPEVREAAPAPTPARTTPKVRAGKRPRKTDVYSEKMSTFLTAEMRDTLEMTARLLQRNRLVKGESITVHTLIRSGVRVMTELLEFTDTDVISSEEELYALVKRKLGL